MQRKDLSRSRLRCLALLPSALRDCERPENVDGPLQLPGRRSTPTSAPRPSLPELVEQLGQRTFGHTPRVGDSFCGGGSIPFEAARIGCEAFGSDLNPVAGLLTWASLNLLGGGKEVQEEVMRVQAEAFAAADRQITAWGIEHNDAGRTRRGVSVLRGGEAGGLRLLHPARPELADWREIPKSSPRGSESPAQTACSRNDRGCQRCRAEALQGKEGRDGGR